MKAITRSGLWAAALLGTTMPLTQLTITATADTNPDVRPQAVCQHPAPGEAQCLEMRLEDSHGRPVDRHGHRLGKGAQQLQADQAATEGLTPDDLRSAYHLTEATSSGRTVAIVAAYGYADAAHDLAAYRAKFGLSPCTVDNGCLTIENQFGQPPSAPENVSWSHEQALDLDAVSATCPDCKILLVQANTARIEDLAAAENTAAHHPGVVAISNSYGLSNVTDRDYAAAFTHPDIAITAATGDGGYQDPYFPASSQHVAAVGGTTLTRDVTAQRGWTETAWALSGSACATDNAAPLGQASLATHCQGRAVADIAAVADPLTGLYTYGPDGWSVAGGTSLASPIIAAIYALSGDTHGYANEIPYAHPQHLNDITTGANGICKHLCKAHKGWDGPTGLGTPVDIGSF